MDNMEIDDSKETSWASEPPTSAGDPWGFSGRGGSARQNSFKPVPKQRYIRSSRSKSPMRDLEFALQGECAMTARDFRLAIPQERRAHWRNAIDQGDMNPDRWMELRTEFAIGLVGLRGCKEAKLVAGEVPEYLHEIKQTTASWVGGNQERKPSDFRSMMWKADRVLATKGLDRGLDRDTYA